MRCTVQPPLTVEITKTLTNPPFTELTEDDDYELQHSLQNATNDFVPNFSLEALYVEQFRKMLAHHATSELVPVATTNKFEVVMQFQPEDKTEPKPSESGSCPEAALFNPTIQKAQNVERAQDIQNIQNIQTVRNLLSITVQPARDARRFVVPARNQAPFVEYLRSKHAYRMRFLDASLPWRFSESHQLFCLLLRQLAIFSRQYLLRTTLEKQCLR